MLKFIGDNIVLVLMVVNVLFLAAMVVMTYINLSTLRSINSLLRAELDTQNKIFKLIRYRRSQEVLDFLNKRGSNSVNNKASRKQ